MGPDVCVCGCVCVQPDNTVKHYQLTNGKIVEGDLYMSAMPGTQ